MHSPPVLTMITSSARSLTVSSARRDRPPHDRLWRRRTTDRHHQPFGYHRQLHYICRKRYRCRRHTVVHNYTHRMSIAEIAEAIKKLCPEAQLVYLKNPRLESETGRKKTVAVHPLITESHDNKDAKFLESLKPCFPLRSFTKRISIRPSSSPKETGSHE